MNVTEIVESVVADQLKSESDFPYFTVGDTLNVHVRIIEGGKERIQVYQGVMIAQKGIGINRTITVRRIVANEGVERVFPLPSPLPLLSALFLFPSSPWSSSVSYSTWSYLLRLGESAGGPERSVRT